MGKYLFTFITLVIIPRLSSKEFYYPSEISIESYDESEYMYELNGTDDYDLYGIVNRTTSGWSNCTVRKNIPCSITYQKFSCLPEGYGGENLWASKPRNLQISYQYAYIHQACHTYPIMTWSLPGDSSALYSLQGFQLDVTPMDEDDESFGMSHCLTFDLKNAKITQQDIIDVQFNFSHFKPMTGKRMNFLLTSLPITGEKDFSNTVELESIIPRAIPIEFAGGHYCRLPTTSTPPPTTPHSVERFITTPAIVPKVVWISLGLLSAVVTLLVIILIFIGCKNMRHRRSRAALREPSEAGSGIRPHLMNFERYNADYDLLSDVGSASGTREAA